MPQQQHPCRRCGVGAPACDMEIAWTFFSGESWEAFRTALPLDDRTCTYAGLSAVEGADHPGRVVRCKPREDE